MKVKQILNPYFDFLCGYVGGFTDIPTKQDKFKPVPNKTLYFKDEQGCEQKQVGEFYVLNNKAKENLKKFEAKFIDCINLVLTDKQPYNIPIQLEVIMNIKMSEKRISSVDVDNLAKCVLDIMTGRVFEDDSQVRSLFVYKDVIIDDIVPQLSGITVGLRVLDKKPSLFSGLKFYDFVEISDEEYNKLNNK